MPQLQRIFLSTTVTSFLIIICMLYVSTLEPPVTFGVDAQDDEVDCSHVSRVHDTCTFVKAHCPDFDSDGLITYLRPYYCAPPLARPYLVVCMLVWLLVIFASMAMAAGDFLSVHLATIVTILGISEDLAGVTIFAFGNGSSDLFSTLAAMNTGNGSLAINELFGAAAFITTVVLGLVMIVRPFSAIPKSFVKDVVWFIIAGACLMAFLADGRLDLGECLSILVIYAAFIGHSLLQLRRADCAVISTIDVHAGNEIDESTRLLAALQDQVVGNPSQSRRFVEDESMEEPRIAPSISTTSICEDTPQGIVIRMFPSIQTWKQQSTGEKVFTLFSLPLLLPIGLTTINPQSAIIQQQPVDRAHNGIRDLTTLNLLRQNLSILPQLFLGPQLLALVLTTQLEISLGSLKYICPTVLALSILLLVLNLTPSIPSVIRRLVNALVGFTISLLWIFLTATSAVSLLTTLGFILHIPTTILGGTIFAIGNSSNDLVANTAVARRGMPVLAASACFGGPMMNMLLGIGIGGLLQVLKGSGGGGGTGNIGQGGDAKGVYNFQVYPGMFVSAGTLLMGLVVTLAYSSLRHWRLDQSLGIGLIILWVIGTTFNIGLSVSGSQLL